MNISIYEKLPTGKRRLLCICLKIGKKLRLQFDIKYISTLVKHDKGAFVLSKIRNSQRIEAASKIGFL